MKILSGDPVTSPFNEWLKSNGVYIAVGVAAVLIIVVIIVLILNKKESKK